MKLRKVQFQVETTTSKKVKDAANEIKAANAGLPISDEFSVNQVTGSVVQPVAKKKPAKKAKKG